MLAGVGILVQNHDPLQIVVVVVIADNMHNIDKEIFEDSLFLYKYLEKFGVDKHETKRDILIVSMLYDIIKHKELIDDCLKCCLSKVYSTLRHVVDSNPQMKYCRQCLTDYNNIK